MPDPRPLADRLRQAGATFGLRNGRPIALHFGSAASELAACRRSVGLLDRSDLDVHLARGRSAVIDQLTDVELGAPLPVGALLSMGETWWGRSAPEEVVVVCGARVSSRLEAQLRAAARRCAGLELEGRPQAPVAIAVIGRAAGTLLGELGTAVPPGPYGQMVRLAVEGVEGSWMLLTDELALALVPPQRAVAAWEAIERAGHTLGLIYVGAEAGERFCIAARMHAAQDASCRP
ncbi:MAG: hypothetical protein WB698_07675 [Solirubrobacteraceae bacterium]